LAVNLRAPFLIADAVLWVDRFCIVGGEQWLWQPGCSFPH
jgi:hypothetical protein